MAISSEVIRNLVYRSAPQESDLDSVQRSPTTKRTLKPAPPMATQPQDISLLGLQHSSIIQTPTVVDPATQIRSPGAGPGAQNPRKRRASGQPAPIAPAPTPVMQQPQQTQQQYGEQQLAAAPELPTGGEQLQQGQPTPKKGRTNTPWTPAEEQRLKQMRDQGKSWSEIAKTFPNRTEGSVKKHWYKVSLFCFSVYFSPSSFLRHRSIRKLRGFWTNLGDKKLDMIAYPFRTCVDS
jgi:hypothetical protein